jgi:hypothetical protein
MFKRRNRNLFRSKVSDLHVFAYKLPNTISSSQARSRVLYLYMNNFDFTNQRLDVSFRYLCVKLYFKAESQQLDRIVEAFAKRYYVCNPTTLLHCFDVVYAVAYALLLLNTDLHLVSDWSHRMTKSSFVKNTMETIQSLVFPYLQRKRCVSLVSTDSSSYHVKRNDSSPSTVMSFEDNTPITSSCNSSQISVHGNGHLSQKLDALRSNISWKSTNTQQVQQQNHDGLTRMRKTWLADVENLLKVRKEAWNILLFHFNSCMFLGYLFICQSSKDRSSRNCECT